MEQSFYHWTQEVRFSDCDPAGIVYFGMYATYFDESFISAIREEGITWDDHERYGFLQPIVEQKTHFRSPLRAGDKFTVRMSVVKLSNRSFRSEHIITAQRGEREDLVAEGYISRVVVDYHSFEPIQIPDPLLSSLKRFKVSEEQWEAVRNKFKT